ncbi:chemotaxis response regulator protein-glutamate methylesterase [Desulfosporosinus sp. OT]|uniref:protein-glutamate methylesterase/protein-glutamine glutaminase n=1 Tax=Desulfosporosinus sp. OT TaxID=913865 RepID=UPI000223AA6B|nr:chemotaxis response regulator protein-glutamate methylesterase [Desulfosporosinus sp. OT]EGW39722.1 response regulator [Desulfosporosinus sp. OT]
MKKIRVLIVDDSIVFREVLSRGIASDPTIEVVATANDPFDASEKIIQFEPDVMTCDVEMPKMSGIEFIRRLLPQYPLPVIVVSTISSAVFDAMNVGAVDFVGKPDVRSVRSVENFINEMIEKVKIASAAKVLQQKTRDTSPKIKDESNLADINKIIAFGASTGGTVAIYNVLRYLPRTMPGIVIVQHIPPGFSRMFAERLNASTNLEVKEAQTGDYVEKGRVLIAPGDQHMTVKKVGERYKVTCFEGDKVNGHCPSVDILFESVAKEAGRNAIGVILTGMGYDGAKGLLALRRKGARTIGQDEKSAVVYGMPKVAYNIGAVEKQTSLESIAQTIYSMLR